MKSHEVYEITDCNVCTNCSSSVGRPGCHEPVDVRNEVHERYGSALICRDVARRNRLFVSQRTLQCARRLPPGGYSTCLQVKVMPGRKRGDSAASV